MSTPAPTLEPQPTGLAIPLVRASVASLALFCIAHFMIDMYSSALGVLQPLLIDRFRLTFTQAGLLGGMLSFLSSGTQPLYGYLSDRFHSRLFSALAPAGAGVFLFRFGGAPRYWLLLLMVVFCGAGLAFFLSQAP